MNYRPMSNPGFGAIDNPIDIPSGVSANPTADQATVNLQSGFNYLGGQDIAAQTPQGGSSPVDLSSAFYYLTGGTPPSYMQTPSRQNPNVVTTPGGMFQKFVDYVQENPGTTLLFAVLLMVMVGGSYNQPAPYRGRY